MGLFDKIMDFIGGESGSNRSGGDRDPESTVTVEHDPGETEAEAEAVTTTAESDPEPAADTEAAVKGVDESATATDHDAESATEADPESDTADSPGVDTINGIGPTYAGRLEAAGIETVADLAAADPAEVADAAQTSDSRAEDWIARASEQ